MVVKQLPEIVSRHQAQELIREVGPFLKDDHPCLVFDFSGVRHLDSAGIEMLLRCMEEAVKRNGDLKLAAIPPAIAVILKLTRVDCLFEIFDNPADAVESFSRFPLYAFRQTREPTYPSAGAEDNDSGATSSEGTEER
ncbi:MAG: STAS domain-containing protein [Terriglobales bacterium]